tara:strand:- start:322 stop:1041 length:720 start_codon:yes stop_codon:yes gene_type:complete
LLFLVSIFLSCNNQDQKVVILSKSSKNYVNWISSDSLIIIDAYNSKSLDSILSVASGIILTGGEDINPLEYNDSANVKLCGPIDYFRDTLERKLFNFALSNKLPLIGVCRGMQMMNVACGGTLYGDLPTEIGHQILHRNYGEVMHDVSICEDNNYYTNFIFPLNQDTFLVNSWHHQGLKQIAENIHVIAKSYDGLPEAVVMDTSVHPFMIAVQFHPERLEKNNLIHTQMRNNFFKALYN